MHGDCVQLNPSQCLEVGCLHEIEALNELISSNEVCMLKRGA